MARKPNYRFERMERERVKAAKKAARAQARADRKAAKTVDENNAVDSDGQRVPSDDSQPSSDDPPSEP